MARPPSAYAFQDNTLYDKNAMQVRLDERLLATGDTATNLTLLGGTVTTANAQAIGAPTTRILSDILSDHLSLRDFGAIGDTVTAVSDGAATGTAFTSTTTVFTAASVGKRILIHGAGTSGVAFETTIAAYVGAHAVTLAAAAPTSVTGATFVWGTDDTAAIVAACTYASALGATLHVTPGRGAYWLNTAALSAPINMSRVSLSGDGCVHAYTPYTVGSTIVVTGTAHAPFDPGAGCTLSGVAFYWPAQDGSAVSPIAYPALLVGTTVINLRLDRVFLVNAYRLLQVNAGGGGSGRIFLDVVGYVIDRVVTLYNGLNDALVFLPSCYWGPGAGADISTTGAQNLRKYTAAYGWMLWIDAASSGSTYPNVDGLDVTGGIAQGFLGCVSVVSGTLDVSQISNLDLDSTPYAMSVTGSGSVVSTSWDGGQLYESQNFSPAAADDVFYFNTTGSIDLNISALEVPFCQGNFLHDVSGCVRRLAFNGVSISNWGNNTGTGGTYYVIAMPNSPVARISINGGVWSGVATTGNNASGALLGNVLVASVNGLAIDGTTTPLTINGSSGAAIVSGVVTTGTIGSKSLVSAITGTASLVASATANNFDKP